MRKRLDDFDVMMKEVLQGLDMPTPANAWDEFEIKRKATSSSSKTKFFLWNFAAAGAALAISLGTLTTLDSQDDGSHTSSHESTRTIMAEKMDVDELSNEGNYVTGGKEFATVSETGLDAHSNGQITTVNSDSYATIPESSISSEDKLSVHYVPVQGANFVSTAVGHSASIQEGGNLLADNLNDVEKESIRRVNQKIQSSADNASLRVDESSSSNTGLSMQGKTVFIGSGFDLDAPIVFTPNDDGLNDSFIPKALDSDDDFVMKILDKDGKEIFRSKNVNKPWNGQLAPGVPAPEGKYNWNVNLMRSSKTDVYTGEVKLMRR